jgi:hypothetical protein
MGLTFDELVILGSVPLVIVFPSLLIKQIPLLVTLAIILISSIGVLAMIVRTPDGQTPTEWAPAAMKRRITPDTYYIKPRTRKREENTVQTADLIREESTGYLESASTDASENAETQPLAQLGASYTEDQPTQMSENPSAGPHIAENPNQVDNV